MIYELMNYPSMVLVEEGRSTYGRPFALSREDVKNSCELKWWKDAVLEVAFLTSNPLDSARFTVGRCTWSKERLIAKFSRYPVRNRGENSFYSRKGPGLMKYISPYYKVFGEEFLWQIIYTSPIYEPFDPSMIATDSIERIIIDSFFWPETT